MAEHGWEWDGRLFAFWRTPGVFGEPRTGVLLESYQNGPRALYETWGLTEEIAKAIAPKWAAPATTDGVAT